MIGHLEGVLLRKTLPAILLDVGGVGYELRVSLNTFEALPAEGQKARLAALTLLRSESLELYGFADHQEKALFGLLLGVNGVGPKLALSILSALAVGDVIGAIRGEQAAVLERVPGIGRKTAQRLVLELRDKLQAWPAAGAPTPAGESGGEVLRDDAIAALENLGYRKVEAQQAVAAALRSDAGGELSLVLRRALRQLRNG